MKTGGYTSQLTFWCLSSDMKRDPYGGRLCTSTPVCIPFDCVSSQILNSKAERAAGHGPRSQQLPLRLFGALPSSSVYVHKRIYLHMTSCVFLMFSLSFFNLTINIILCFREDEMHQSVSRLNCFALKFFKHEV
jgi:hypothetical protein